MTLMGVERTILFQVPSESPRVASTYHATTDFGPAPAAWLIVTLTVRALTAPGTSGLPLCMCPI